MATSSKRARSPSKTPSDSSNSFEDIIGHAHLELEDYGVSWRYFERGSKRATKQAAFMHLKNLVIKPEVTSYYVGVCKSPAHRYFNEPAPHKKNYDVLFPLLVGKNMGKTERNFLRVLRVGGVVVEKLKNLSTGGEGIHPRSVRFLYVCVTWRKCTSGG